MGNAKKISQGTPKKSVSNADLGDYTYTHSTTRTYGNASAHPVGHGTHTPHVIRTRSRGNAIRLKHLGWVSCSNSTDEVDNAEIRRNRTTTPLPIQDSSTPPTRRCTSHQVTTSCTMLCLMCARGLMGFLTPLGVTLLSGKKDLEVGRSWLYLCRRQCCQSNFKFISDEQQSI